MERSGHGTDPVVCCHGGPGLWDYFQPVAELLADVATVYRWDQRGAGRSDARGPYSVARCIDDLEEVRRQLGLATMALLGHSWGASLALRYALRHPDRVSKLVYISGVGLGRDWKQPYQRARQGRLTAPQRARIDELAARRRTTAEDRELAVLQWSTDFADRATALQLAERLATPWFPINYDCNRAINDELEREGNEPDLVAACRGLHLPTLILDGAEDPRPRWALDSLERALPDVTRVVLPATGHVPWLEAPARFGPPLGAFLGATQG